LGEELGPFYSRDRDYWECDKEWEWEYICICFPKMMMMSRIPVGFQGETESSMCSMFNSGFANLYEYLIVLFEVFYFRRESADRELFSGDGNF